MSHDRPQAWWVIIPFFAPTFSQLHLSKKLTAIPQECIASEDESGLVLN
jgi:hypothetical protein